MKERPILFSTDMVRAILDGRKTQTRRVVKANISCDTYRIEQGFIDESIYSQFSKSGLFIQPYIKCPYGQPGDVLWVRETFSPPAPSQIPTAYMYAADYPVNPFVKGIWKPSIHMPKSAARIWLQIESIGVERLMDITSEDAIAEGVEIWHHGRYRHYYQPEIRLQTARGSFRTLWVKINGPDSWEQNPWVWVVKFKVLSTTGKPQNITEL